MSVAIPLALEEITAEWLTSALAARYVDTAPTVTAVRVERIGEGLGFVGQIGHLTLTYAAGSSGPATLVAKIPAAAPVVRKALRFAYEHEVAFYERIGAEAGVAVPRCDFLARNEANGASVLLLEDLSDSRSGDQIAGCSRADAETVIDALATMHGRWWQAGPPDDRRGIPFIGDPDAPGVGLLLRSYAGFARDWAAVAPPRLRRAVERTSDVGLLGALLGRTATPVTLTHGDCRADNLFFDAAGRPTFIDWQVTRWGNGLLDVAYFLGGSLAPDHQREWGPELLRRYHGALIGAGVEGYGWERCRQDHRAGLARLLAVVLIALTNLDAWTERGQTLIQILFDRTEAALELADFDGLLAELG